MFADGYCQTKRSRFFIIDTGSSTNTLREKRARETLSDYIQETRSVYKFSTAGGRTKGDQAVRAQIGCWAPPADFMVIDKGGELLSVGEHCVMAGFSFIWIKDSFPCFLSYGGQYIVIFDTDNLVPVWSPDMEYSDDFFGTYEFYLNIFRDRCGIYINDRKEVCLNITLGMGVKPMECTDPLGEYVAHGTLNSNHHNYETLIVLVVTSSLSCSPAKKNNLMKRMNMQLQADSL